MLTGINGLSEEDLRSETHPHSTLYMAYSPNESILKAWWKSFWITLVLCLISLHVLGAIGNFAFLLAYLWLGFEMFRSVPPSTKIFPGEIILKLIAIIFISIGLFCFPGAVLHLFEPRLFPALLTALYGACAGAVRFKRSLASKPHIGCECCELPMEEVEEDELRHKLSKVQNISWSIGSVLYEGWRCPSCCLNHSTEDLDLHLFSKVVLPREFEYCHDCDGLTISSEEQVTQFPTISSSGERVVTLSCACCDQTTQVTEVIPRVIPRQTYSSSSSSSSNRDTSSSYSSSESSSNSGDSGNSSYDFGGGSSGGGGAGDSW